MWWLRWCGASVFGSLMTTLANLAVAETVTITADNYYDLYLNGVLIGSQNNGDGVYGWDAPEVWFIELQPGQNVLAVYARDESPTSGSGIGVIARIDMGPAILLVTDGSWKVSAAGLEGWTGAGFDDSGWEAPLDQGPYDSSPWTNFATPIGAFAGSDARWLWRGNPPYHEGYGYYNTGDHFECYLRRTVVVEATPIGDVSWGKIKMLYRRASEP